MAIVSVDRVWSGETWSDDRDGSREYEELWRVVSDDPDEDPSAVGGADGLPLLWSAYHDDEFALANKRTCRRHDSSRLIWEVTISYATLSPEEEEENPLSRPPTIRWSSTLASRAVAEDRNGEAIVNSAGDYFDPPPEADRPLWTVNVQANVAAVPAGIMGLMGAVNSGSFTIDGVTVSAENGRIVALEISEVKVENDVTFRTITYGIAIDPDGFDVVALDQGFRERDGEGNLVDIYIEPDEDHEDESPQRASAPVLLDGEGGKLSDPSPENAVFLVYEVSPRTSFSGLPGVS